MGFCYSIISAVVMVLRIQGTAKVARRARVRVRLNSIARVQQAMRRRVTAWSSWGTGSDRVLGKNQLVFALVMTQSKVHKAAGETNCTCYNFEDLLLADRHGCNEFHFGEAYLEIETHWNITAGGAPHSITLET